MSDTQKATEILKALTMDLKPIRERKDVEEGEETEKGLGAEFAAYMARQHERSVTYRPPCNDSQPALGTSRKQSMDEPPLIPVRRIPFYPSTVSFKTPK